MEVGGDEDERGRGMILRMAVIEVLCCGALSGTNLTTLRKRRNNWSFFTPFSSSEFEADGYHNATDLSGSILLTHRLLFCC